MSDRGSADMEFAERAQEAERQLAAALTEIRTANEVLAAQAEAAAMWDRLLAIWQSEDGEPTKAHDYEVLERIAALVTEWNLAQPPVIVPSSQVAPYIATPIELADPVELPSAVGPRTRTVAHEGYFFDDDNLAPPPPGTFSNKVDWTAGMAVVKAASEAIVASAAPGPYQHCAVTGHWFREEVDADTSTRICPCGDRFTWSGVSPDIEAWMVKHVRHALAPIPLDEMRSMLAQAARLADALKVSAELAEDLRSDMRINLKRVK